MQKLIKANGRTQSWQARFMQQEAGGHTSRKVSLGPSGALTSQASLQPGGCTQPKRTLMLLWEGPGWGQPAGEGLGWMSPSPPTVWRRGFCSPGPLLGRARRGGLPPTCLWPLPGWGPMARPLQSPTPN